jgi:iron complex transport system substrate-binding protein
MIGAQLQRADAATALVTHVQQRLARLHDTPRPYSALYLRPNGGSAGTGTYVDAVFAAAGLRNHAADQGQNGWGRFALETLVARPPDLFVFSDFIRDTAYSRSGFGRHPLLQNLLQQRPVISLAGKYWGCGNWQLIEAAEDIAAQIDRLVPASAPEVWL